VVSLTGVITAKAISRALAGLVTSSSWDPGYNTLWDGLAVDQVTLTPEALNDLVALSDSLRGEMGPGREAIVVRPDVSRTYTRLFAGPGAETRRQRHTFHAREPALRWLIRARLRRTHRALSMDDLPLTALLCHVPRA